MIELIQDLLDQKELYQRLRKRVESLEKQLEDSTEAPSLESSTPEHRSEDDLTRIKGVGKVIAGKLQALGISSFKQVAQLSGSEIPELEEKLGLFSGKINRENWIAQAKSFLS